MDFKNPKQRYKTLWGLQLRKNKIHIIRRKRVGGWNNNRDGNN